MRIRTQNILTITPIFIVMIIIIDIMTFTSQREELLWGIREEISTLAASIGEFTDAEVISNLENKNKSSSRKEDGLKGILSKIKKYKQLQKLAILAPDRFNILFEYGGKILYKDDARRILERVKDNQVFVSEIIGKDNNSFVAAYAPVFDSKAKLLAVINITTSAAYYFTQLDNIILKLVLISILTIVAGITSSLIISSIVTQKIKRLNDSASLMNRGYYDNQIEAGTIKEVSDLSNTFNTMGSILGEELSRTRRALIESEQFRTASDIASRFNELLWKPIDYQFKGYGIYMRTNGDFSEGSLFGAVHGADNLYCIIGRVKEGAGMDASINASAAYSLIADSLKRNKPEDVLKDITSAFDFDVLQCIQVDSEKNIREIKYTGSDNEISGQGITFENSVPLAFHSLGEEAGRTIRLYLKLFENRKTADLMNSILSALKPDAEGVILLIGRS